MATPFSAATISEAQVQTQTKLYDLYQNETDLWKDLEKVPSDQVNYKGLQVPIELSPNPSLGYRPADGDALPTPLGPKWDNFTVSYVGLQMGLAETYAAYMNNGIRTSAGWGDVLKSNARQFASVLNQYATTGNGTQKLATVSTNYSGGTPTIAVCNGSADSLGPAQLIPGGRYQVFDATGATLRNATIGGQGIVTLASKTAANAVGATNWPSDMIATDIIVPAVGTGANASFGLYGLPQIIESTGSYFGVSRASVNGLASYEKAMGGGLTAGALAETYAALSQRGGYLRGNNLADSLWIYLSMGNWLNYINLALATGAIVGSPNQFMHTPQGAPAYDVGYKTPDLTYFGAPCKILNWAEGSEIYFANPKVIRRAILKDVGRMDGFPAADWLQGIDASGNYQNQRVGWNSFFGQIYSPQPFRLGKISGITLSAVTQKANMSLMNG